MKPYENYMLISDLDGTIVPHGKAISAANAEAIRAFVAGGGLFGIATGRTPEAAGVTFIQLMKAALSVIHGCRIVACDMVELSPPLDASGASTATALKLLREMLLAFEEDFIRPQIV